MHNPSLKARPSPKLIEALGSNVTARRACGLAYETGSLPSVLQNSIIFWRLPHDLRRSVYRITQRARNIGEKRPVSEPNFLKLSQQTKSLFIHIPKSAGISIREAIYGQPVGYHRTISDYSLCFDKETYDSLWKFTFVRNPFNRVISAFFYLKQGGRSYIDHIVKQKLLDQYSTFPEFVLALDRMRHLMELVHLRPQESFLKNPTNGNIEADFIGRFESIQQDFQLVCERLGIRQDPLPRRNTRRAASIEHASYYNARTRKIISGLYKRDFEAFGYCR